MEYKAFAQADFMTPVLANPHLTARHAKEVPWSSLGIRGSGVRGKVGRPLARQLEYRVVWLAARELLRMLTLCPRA